MRTSDGWTERGHLTACQLMTGSTDTQGKTDLCFVSLLAELPVPFIQAAEQHISVKYRFEIFLYFLCGGVKLIFNP